METDDDEPRYRDDELTTDEEDRVLDTLKGCNLRDYIRVLKKTMKEVVLDGKCASGPFLKNVWLLSVKLHRLDIDARNMAKIFRILSHYYTRMLMDDDGYEYEYYHTFLNDISLDELYNNSMVSFRFLNDYEAYDFKSEGERAMIKKQFQERLVVDWNIIDMFQNSNTSHLISEMHEFYIEACKAVRLYEKLFEDGNTTDLLDRGTFVNYNWDTDRLKPEPGVSIYFVLDAIFSDYSRLTWWDPLDSKKLLTERGRAHLDHYIQLTDQQYASRMQEPCLGEMCKAEGVNDEELERYMRSFLIGNRGHRRLRSEACLRCSLPVRQILP